MIVKVVIKHSEEALWDESKELYSCNSAELAEDVDPIAATILPDLKLPGSFQVGAWLKWDEFCNSLKLLEDLQALNVPIDLSVLSFPDFGGTSLPIMIDQADAAKMFLESIRDHLPKLRDDLSGVWIRVD